MLPSSFQFAITIFCLSTIVACAPRHQTLTHQEGGVLISNTQGINGKELYQKNSLLPNDTTTSMVGDIKTTDLSAYDPLRTGSIQSTTSSYSNPMGASGYSIPAQNVYQPQQSIATPAQTAFKSSQAIGNSYSGAKPQNNIYSVQSGDTIYSIGRKFNMHPSTIMSLNGINNSSTLSVGQKIMLLDNMTSVQQVMPSSVTKAIPATPSPSSQYNVQAGDTIYAIGRKFNMKPSQIIQKNPHINPNQLSVGQTITISQSNIQNSISPSAVTHSADNLSKIKEKLQAGITQSASQESHVQKKLELQKTAFNNPTIKPLGQTKASNYSALSLQKTQEQQSLGKVLAMPINGSIKEDKNLRGILISAKDGDRVKASADGEVIYVGNLSNYGNMILVRHQNGLVTNYARLKKTFVRKGQHVSRGDLIAAAGETQGFNSSDVLFEVRKGTKAVNPLDYAS